MNNRFKALRSKQEDNVKKLQEENYNQAANAINSPVLKYFRKQKPKPLDKEPT